MDVIEETRWYELIKVCVEERVSGAIVIRWQDHGERYYVEQRERVFLRLKAKGWSPSDVSRLIGMCTRQVRRIFNGHKA